MGRAKSVLVSMEITVAGSSHNCRSNDGHRIKKGVKRLTIKEDGTPLHYCLPCARLFLKNGITRLQAMQRQVDSALAESASDVETS